MRSSSQKEMLNEKRSKLKQQGDFMEGIAQIHQFFVQKQLALD